MFFANSGHSPEKKNKTNGLSTEKQKHAKTKQSGGFRQCVGEIFHFTICVFEQPASLPTSWHCLLTDVHSHWQGGGAHDTIRSIDKIINNVREYEYSR